MWSGLPDPAITRQELEAESDVGRYAATAFIEGWQQLQEEVGVYDGLTTRQAHDYLMSGTKATILRAVLEDVAGGTGRLPNPHTIGRHLREIRDRNFNGKCIKCVANKNGHRWFVDSILPHHKKRDTVYNSITQDSN